MSERALQTRIWKIRRVDKLHSFVKVGAGGRRQVAAGAQKPLNTAVFYDTSKINHITTRTSAAPLLLLAATHGAGAGGVRQG